MFKLQLTYLFLAVEYYTRLSKPVFPSEDIDATDRAIRYYPIIGGIIGLFSAIIAVVTYKYLDSKALCFLSALAASVIITGSIHEKGFTRFCDGMGEGTDKDSILSNMQDKHINTYGILGIIFILLFKFCALTAIPFTSIVTVIIVGQVVSRACAGILTVELDSIKQGDRKPLFSSVHGEDFSTRFYIMVLAGGLALVGSHGLAFYEPLIALTFFYLLFKYYIQNKLQGYTDDCISACQQLAELVFYLSCVVSLQQ